MGESCGATVEEQIVRGPGSGNDDVQRAIAVDVAESDCIRGCVTTVEGDDLDEGACAVVEQHLSSSDVVSGILASHDVEVAIAVDIPMRHRHRARAPSSYGGGAEPACSIADQ